MAATSTIYYLQHHEIDKQQWDARVNAAANKLVYAYSFYLDHLSPSWHALAGENYDWILPLTWKQKFGIKYLYQPPFTQQLGVFYKHGVEVPFAKIIEQMQQRFSFCEVQWNYETQTLTADVQVKKATNYLLDLSQQHAITTNNYSKDVQRNIRRGSRVRLKYEPAVDVSICIELYKQHYADRTPHVTKEHYNEFAKLCHYLFEKQMAYCRQVVNEEGTILAVALLLFDGSRLYNVMNTTTDAGRKMEANYFLFNNIIKEFSGSNILFDFEGSDLPGVASFYRGFGAVDQPYFHVKYNHLPAPLRWLKR